MDSLIDNLKAHVAPRYQIATKPTPEGLLIECLDSNNNLITVRRLSSIQLKNRVLLVAIINDLRSQLRYE